MKLFPALSLLMCFGSTIALLVDYCAEELCDEGVVHVACNATTGFADHCDESATEIAIDEPLRKLILHHHNLCRSQVANGMLPGFPSAANMPEMQWDDQLAYVAGFNVRTCKMKHDSCRATPAFSTAGQNLAKTGHSHQYPDPSETVVKMIRDMWFTEHENCPAEIVNAFKGHAKAVVGHFTAMIQERSDRVGCAMSQFVDNGKWFSTLFACNYSYTNMLGVEVYAVGKPCMAGEPNCSVAYPGLVVERVVGDGKSK